MTTKNVENGRSMVEMLGTLAIIGVLSVGAIAGYSYAMDKYRANTIINDLTLRSVDVIAQLNTKNTIDLSDWPMITAGKYPIRLEDNSTGIQVSGLSNRVCQMVFDGLIRQATIKIQAMEYDSPTDTNVCATDNNTMVFYFDEEAQTPDTKENENNPEIETETETKTETETEITETEITETETTTGGDCTSNTDCAPTQYCADKNDSAEIAHPYECRNLNFSEQTINGKMYYLSQTYLSWWDADAACKALGRKLGKTIEMISISDLASDWDEYLQNKTANWTDSISFTKTPLAEGLRKNLFGDTDWLYYLGVWTSDSYDSHLSFVLFPEDGLHSTIERNQEAGGIEAYYAVCK